MNGLDCGVSVCAQPLITSQYELQLSLMQNSLIQFGQDYHIV